MTNRTFVLGFIWILSLAATGDLRAQSPSISSDRLKARKELGLLSVEYSKESFVKQASEGDTIAVQLFIAAGMNPNAVSDRGTALIAASRAGHAETVRALIAAGADVNGNYQGTALTSATRPDIVNYLLDHGADVNAKNDIGHTALIRAARELDLNRLKMLIDRGADVDARDYQRRTALLMVADEAGQAENANRGANRLGARLPDRLNVIKMLLARKADVNARDNDGKTALRLAAGWGGDAVAEVLLDHDASVNEKAADGSTPLIAAVLAQNAELVKRLLAKGADPNATTGRSTVLSLALQGRSSAIAQLLINAGAK